jgi:parallel beta-helix repeat protein
MSIQGRFRNRSFVSLALLTCCLLGFSAPQRQAASQHQATRPMIPPQRLAQVPVGTVILYVNAATGIDAPTSGKAEATPFKTITYALQQVPANRPTVIQIASGSYTKDNGEVFPLTLKPGVMLVGDEASQGKTTTIIGGGSYLSPSFATQNVTIVAANNAEIRGVSVTNPTQRGLTSKTAGTGVWIEGTNPTIANSSFVNNARDGIFVTGTANPTIVGSFFFKNNGNGLVIETKATGTVKGNLFQDNGFGIAIGGTAAPLIEENQVVQNISGFYINNNARPTLRRNTITDNQDNGVVITANAQPDLGTEQSPGGNLIRRNNTKKVKDVADLNNITKNVISAISNDIDPKTIIGPVTFTPAGTGEIPTIPPTPTPTPTPTGSPSPTPTPTPTPTGSPSPTPTPTGSPTPGAFKDVPSNFWAKGFIDTLAAQGVISGSGDGNFKPNASITRAEFAAIINKAFAPAPINPAKDFVDVAKGKWYYDAIQTASRGGFMAGYKDNTFKPELNIPRVQIVVAIANGVGYGKNPANLDLLTRFTDGTAIPDYAKNPVAAATQRKVVVNYPYPEQFLPNQQATRAEVAAFIYQALVDLGRVPAIPSKYIVNP